MATTITSGPIRAVCDTTEEAAALMMLLLQHAPKNEAAPAEPTEKRAPAKRAPAKRKPSRAKAAKPAPAPKDSSPKGGRKPSAFTLAVYAALRVTPNPNFDAIAKQHGADVDAAKGVIQRGVASGKLKKLPTGGWKVVG